MTYLEASLSGASASGKTLRWALVPKGGGAPIGDVEWYAPWRKYCFTPRPNTVFEQVCLREIADFCEQKTREHKQAKTSGRPATGFPFDGVGEKQGDSH